MITLETRAPSDTSTPELETKSSSYRFLFPRFFLSSLTFSVVSKLCTYVRTYVEEWISVFHSRPMHGSRNIRENFRRLCLFLYYNLSLYILLYISAITSSRCIPILRASYIRARGIEAQGFHRSTKLIRVHRRTYRRNHRRNVSHRRNIGYVRKNKILYNSGLSIGLCKPSTSNVLTYISKIRMFLSGYVGKKITL